MIRYWFYVYENGVRVASGVCPTREKAEKEAAHYQMMYAMDGALVTTMVRRVTSKG
jgi:hypothetical protein